MPQRGAKGSRKTVQEKASQSKSLPAHTILNTEMMIKLSSENLPDELWGKALRFANSCSEVEDDTH